jgi:bifunctional DNA-binding transcriptional regulator/antitoxin component of YhaV-PrlF toxin-antitoxin module
MKDTDTMTVSKLGQGTLPKWWREATGLSQGGVVEVRPLRDVQNSLILTPKPGKRRGAVGLLEHLRRCPRPIPPPSRHYLPSR